MRSRHRLLERHAAEYQKWAADNELCIDGNAPHPVFNFTNPGVGLLPEYRTGPLASSEAKAALALLPADRRNVLVSAEQLRPPRSPGPAAAEDARRAQISATEFAAILGGQGVEERRQMVSAEQEMRMYHVDSMELLYSALMRTAPDKYPRTGARPEPAVVASSGAIGVAGSVLQPDYRSALTGVRPPPPPPPPAPATPPPPLALPAAAASATIHAPGISNVPPRNPATASRDPRLEPPRDPRLARR